MALPSGTGRTLNPQQRLAVRGQSIEAARTFGDVPRGQAFWYANACGLAEIAVNQGSAREQLGLQVGDNVLL